MPRHTTVQNSELLKAALEGLEAQKKRIEEQIGQVLAYFSALKESLK